MLGLMDSIDVQNNEQPGCNVNHVMPNSGQVRSFSFVSECNCDKFLVYEVIHSSDSQFISNNLRVNVYHEPT